MIPRAPDPVRPLAVLLAGLGLAWFPHSSALPLWISLVFGSLLVLRLLLALREMPLPGRKILLLPTILCSGWAIFGFRPFFGGPGAFMLLSTMCILKLYEMNTRRDRTIVVLLGYVIVATRFLTGQSPLTGLWMLLLVALFTFVLVEYADETGGRTAGTNLRIALRMLFYSLPVAALLFVIFPRHGGPLWVLSSNRSAMTGLSEELTPGNITKLSQSDEAAFTATIETGLAEAGVLYWRGPVFDYFDGNTWKSTKKDEPPAAEPVIPKAGEIVQRVSLEPSNQRWLFALDRPLSANSVNYPGRDGTLRSRDRNRKRIDYTAVSSPETGYFPLTREEENRQLALPENLSERVLELAKSFREGGADDNEVLERILKFFKEGGFLYTLAPPEYQGDFIDGFLFGERKGFCGHFAASLGALLRGAGIPARVVTGYLGAEQSPGGNYLLVLQEHAHAWNEAWIAGRGWVRVDPTAVVSPERLTRPIDVAASLESGGIRFGMEGGDYFSGFAGKMRLAFYSFGDWWNSWIVGYDLSRQRELLRSLGAGGASRALLLSISLALLFLWLLAVAVLYAIRERARLDPAERLWRGWVKRLDRRGLGRNPREGPRDFTARVATARPGVSREAGEIGELYSRLRYGKPALDTKVSDLREAIRKFPWKKL